MVFSKEFCEKVDYDKKSADNKKAWKITQGGGANYSGGKELKIIHLKHAIWIQKDFADIVTGWPTKMTKIKFV